MITSDLAKSVSKPAHDDRTALCATGVAEASQSVPRGKKHPRRRLRQIGLVLVIGAIVITGWSRTSNFRYAAHRCLAAGYDLWDPLMQEIPVDLGPGSEAKAANANLPLSTQLEAWFPQYRFSVTNSASLPALVDSVFFQHESLQGKRIGEFRESAAPILQNANNIFDLSSRVRGLTEHGDAGELVGSDPLAFLQHAQEGKPLSCRHFSLILGECAIAKGYTSRLIGLSEKGTKFDHAVVEVYVPELGKWVVFDPDFNVVYRRRGEWQNAGELHDAWQEINHRRYIADPPAKARLEETLRASRNQIARDLGLEMVVLGDEGDSLRRTNLISNGTGMGLRFYERVIYHTRNNYLSGYYPLGHRKRSFQYVLQPKEEVSLPPICPEGEIVSSREQLYFPVGRTSMELNGRAGEDAVRLQLSTWTPNFDYFEVRHNSGEWRRIKSPSTELSVMPGTQHIEARSVNLGGVRGEAAVLQIEIQPNEAAILPNQFSAD